MSVREPEGPTQRVLRRLGRRHAAIGRTAVALITVPIGVLAAPAAHRGATAVVGAVVLCWSVIYVRRLRSGYGRLLVVGDVAVVVGVCLTQNWTVPVDAIDRGGGGWVIVLASLSVVAIQVWTTVVQGGVSVLVIVSALLAGVAMSPHGLAVSSIAIPLWVLAEAILAQLLWQMALRTAAVADSAVAAAERVRRDTAVHEAERAEERAYAATLHDTAATTLLMVGLGEVRRTDRWLVGQARRDLDALLPPMTTAVAAVDLAAGLRNVVKECPLIVDTDLPDVLELDPAAAEAMCGAVREALNNVMRHSGVRRAEVRRTETASVGVVIEVVDRGDGFEHPSASGNGHGIARSISARMAAIGGSGDVTSRPGVGTTVRLAWPAATVDG